MAIKDDLFRREAGRLVALLTRIFGVHNLALAEDVVQDAFCRALEVWKFRGVPENPSAWLMAAAKNRALDVLRRERNARRFAPELGRLLDSEWTLACTIAEAFEPHAIKDDRLRMMFTCCHPRLPEEAQVALTLHLLCGFGVKEIAAAFLKSPAAMEKKLARAKRTLAATESLFDLKDGAEIAGRLGAVQRALYLLFNEGHHGGGENAVRVELCREAMHLAGLMLDHPLTATPATLALHALMCLHAARQPARLDAAGDLAAFSDQDRARWDKALIASGLALLDRSATGTALSEYHLEAGIAALHAEAARPADTDWPRIVALYDLLLKLRPSPVVALHRAVAVGEAEGAAAGLAAIDAIADRERLARYPFFHAALGEMELRRGRAREATAHFGTALDLARNVTERRFLERRLEACRGREIAASRS